MSYVDLKGMSKSQLVTHALVLGLTAPTDEVTKQACEIADFFATWLSIEEIEACKAAALQMAEGHIGGGAA